MNRLRLMFPLLKAASLALYTPALTQSADDANSWSRHRTLATGFVALFRYNQFGYNIVSGVNQ